MSDRRAVSAGHLAASSVAANEPWRVAVGGNRVQNMTVEQIAQAFAAGQLTVRTPLWPPGTSGWQALGNFEQFLQSGSFAAHQDYAQLSQFEEADDDPTRMWTGSADLSELPGMGMQGGAPLPPVAALPPPSVPVAAARPSARTGPRQVSSRAPAARSLPAPVARTASVAPAPAEVRALRPRRSSGLWLVAGLVGLVGLGSAVLAARGDSVVGSAEAPATAALAVVPSIASASAEPKKVEEPSPAAAAPSVEAQATPPQAEVNQAQLAKYEDTAAPAFVAEAQVSAPEKSSDEAAARKSAAEHESSSHKDTEAKSERSARSSAKHKEPAKVRSSRRATARATHRRAPAEPKVEAKEIKGAKAEPKADAQPAAGSAVSEAAAVALGNAAKLASSCRPRGGPSGSGKARVVYSNDGEVKQVEILTAKFRDTLTGSCVNMVFRRAKIAAFKGEPPTFIKSFTIPEE